jgi:Fe-S oxidoreductase
VVGKIVVSRKREESPFKDLVAPASKLDQCLTCGTCAGGCPVADWDGLDPRKVIRMIQYGLEDEVIKAKWIWNCTNCQRCTWGCPMGINFGQIVTNARSKVPRDQTPGEIQKTANNHREMMNNMRLTVEDAIETFEWMAGDLKEEIPDFELPIDKEGAEFFCTINSKNVQYYPMDLMSIYKIFHAAKASWTISSKWWEGTNYALFTGDFDTWEYTLRGQAKRVEELGCKTMAYTE